MTIIDRQGRLFGKISILDLGAACIILLVLIGLFVVPGPTGSVAQITSTQPVAVDVLVRGLGVGNLDKLFEVFKEQPQANIIIRSQPAGTIDIKSAREIERTVSVPQPDGSVQALPDPRPEITIVRDLLITIQGQGQVTNDGVVLGKQKVKIGTGIELDGSSYNFNGSVIEVRS
ncbi:DUF4330 domain-containing protein [Gloeocapsa sp. PCC 73106]|uniref:DUF4330 domain-containing protein n=1 Tax=Gloeocapsa sp. PCC 73106 TaxID=102232 RepID=UPI0002AC65E7|nr:DUF4330 domain-containing protein [Gloeocapsa sp. PCC 73106]ELR97230.1 hypothetical protein GLO73106DRAFT_00010360 [Gloeocapsa sp. PCC 73106]